MAQFGDSVVLDTSIDGRVIAFVAGLAVIIIGLTAIAPARGALRALTSGALAEGGRAASEGRGGGAGAQRARGRRSSRSRSRWWFRACSARGRSTTCGRFRRASTSITSRSSRSIRRRRSTTARSRSYMASVQQRVAGLPGVRAAGFGRIVPLGFGGSRMTVIIPGYQPSRRRRHGAQLQRGGARLSRCDGHPPARRALLRRPRHRRSAGRDRRQPDDGRALLAARKRRRRAGALLRGWPRHRSRRRRRRREVPNAARGSAPELLRAATGRAARRMACSTCARQETPRRCSPRCGRRSPRSMPTCR